MAGGTIGNLLVKMSVDMARFSGDMRQAAAISRRTSDQITNHVRGINTVFRTMLGVGIGYAIARTFKYALDAIDEFKIATIGVAATLTDLSKAKDPTKAFGENLEYATQMFYRLELEAAKHFATGTELQQGMNILVQKGVIAREEDLSALGTIIDKIKIMTQGQESSKQIATELRAIIDGQARATSQVSMLLKDQLGAGWEELVKKHKEAGDLLQWIASLWPGLDAATKKIQETLEAQVATLSTHLKYLARGGIGGAYESIVGLVKQINDYLEINRDIIAVGISDAIRNIKPLFEDILWVVKKIGSGLLEAAKIYNLMKSWSEDLPASEARKRIYGEGKFGGAMVPGLEKMAPIKLTIPSLGMGGTTAEGGGGKGGKGGGSALLKELNQLKKEAEKAAKEAGAAAKDAWWTGFNTQKFMRGLHRPGSRWSMQMEDVLGKRVDPMPKFGNLFGRMRRKEREGGAGEFAGETAKKFGQTIMDTLQGKEDSWMQFGTWIADSLGEKALDWFGSIIKNTFTNIFAETSTGFLESIITSGDILLEAGKGIFDFIKEGASFLLEVGKSILSGIASAFGGGGGGGPIGSIIGVVASFLPFHKGGMVRAHSGLNIGADEIPLIAQRGEGIVSKAGMKRIGAGGLSAINRGTGSLGGDVIININPRHPLTTIETESIVRRKIIPAMQRNAARYGGV